MKKKNINTKKHLISILVLFYFIPSFATTADSLIFKAMQDELNRSLNELKVPGTPPIYRLTYYLSDKSQVKISASMGAVLYTEKILDRRRISVNLSLGNREFSSDLDYNYNSFPNMNYTISDNNYSLLRRDFWKVTDNAYKAAQEMYIFKKDNIDKSILTNLEKQVLDYNPIQNTSLVHISKEGKKISDKTLEEIAAKTSRALWEQSKVSETKVEIEAITIDHYSLSSEGIKIKEPVKYISVQFIGKVRRESNNVVFHKETFILPYSQDETSESYLLSRVTQFATVISKFNTVSILDEDYIGPVMFMNNAISEIFMNNLITTAGIISFRKPISQLINPLRAYTYDATKIKTSEDRINKKIIDPNFSVYNFAQLDSYNNIPLVGSYKIDSEGATPKNKITLIENGILLSHLSGRIPTMSSKETTGSVRFGVKNYTSNMFIIAPGILEVKATKTLSSRALIKGLLKAAKSEGLDYAYIVKDISPFTQVITRIYVKDGHEEILIGASISEITLSKLRRVLASSKSTYASNILFKSNVPLSIIHPQAIILEDVEISRQVITKLQETSLIDK